MRFRSVLLVAVAALVGGAASLFAPGVAPAARALTAADVVGTWKLRFVGDGWQRGDDGVVQSRVRGFGLLTVTHADPDRNTGTVHLEVALDAAAQESLLGDAVPPKGTAPAFRATAAVIGNAISAIYAGQPDYVNAMTLRFVPGGKKAAGTWFLAFPASDASDTATFATGLAVTVRGTRLRGRAADPGALVDPAGLASTVRPSR